MDKNTRHFGWLLSLQVQLVAFMAGGFFGGKWLDERYPIKDYYGLSWVVVCLVIGFVLCVHTLWAFMKVITRKDD